MASSSKVQFKLEKLKELAVETIDLRIAQKEDELAQLGSPEDQAERMKAWRAATEAKISNVFRELDTLSDALLAQFTIDKIPQANRWDTERRQRDLDRLRADRAKMLAKANSLVPDEDGNVALTKTQLKEFFEL